MLLRVRAGDRVLSGVAAGLALLSVACCAAAIILHPRLLDGVDVPAIAWSDVVLGTIYPVAGAVIVRTRPRNAIGWVLVSASMMGPYLMAATIGGWSVLVRTEELPLTDLLLWFGIWGFVPYFYVLPMVLLLFPDGRPATPRWRPVVISIATVATVAIAVRMVTDVELDMVPQAMNPLGLIGPPIQYVTLVGSFAVLFGGSLLGVLSLRTRARRAVGASRAQLQWLSLGGMVLVMGLFGSAIAGGGAWTISSSPQVWPDRRSRSRWRCCVTSCSTSSSRSTARSCSSCSARSWWVSTSAWSSPWAASRRRRGSAWPSSRSWRSWQPADAASCRRVSTAGCSGTAATHTPSSPASGATSRRRASRRRRCSAWPTRCVTRSDFHTSPSTGR